MEDKKRRRQEDEENSEGEEGHQEGGPQKRAKSENAPAVGPPAPRVGPGRALMTKGKEKEKKKRTLKFEQLYLDKLPSAEMYERSYMHRDFVTHTAVSAKDYIITASRDGHVKFWKKQPEGIEFVKHFRAHLGNFAKLCGLNLPQQLILAQIVGLAVSHDGGLLCTSSVDKTLKIFDVVSFGRQLIDIYGFY